MKSLVLCTLQLVLLEGKVKLSLVPNSTLWSCIWDMETELYPFLALTFRDISVGGGGGY
jgi:hypothetical protein